MKIIAYLILIIFFLPASLNALEFKKLCRGKWCYYVENIQGWEIYYSENFVKSDRKHVQEVKKLLVNDLMYIDSKIPPKTLKKMKAVKIHISLFDPGGRATFGVYHYSREVLLKRNQDPEKFEAIEIANTDNYLNYTSSQPAVILHELGHAFIHQYLSGEEKEKLETIYKEAVVSRRYEEVPYFNGVDTFTKKAYALKDFYEYFCEILEAYYWRNDYYPFNQIELKKYDIQGYKFIQETVGD